MGNLVPVSVRRSIGGCEADVFSPTGSGSGSSLVTSPSSSGGHFREPQPASSSLAASMLLLRPRAFARQLSDDLRRRRESYAAGQYGTSSGIGGGASSCYSPLAAHSSGHHHHHLHQHLHHHRQHRHSVGGFQLLPSSSNHSLLLQPGSRLHPVAIAAAAAANASASSSHAGKYYETKQMTRETCSFINSNPRPVCGRRRFSPGAFMFGSSCIGRSSPVSVQRNGIEISSPSFIDQTRKKRGNWSLSSLAVWKLVTMTADDIYRERERCSGE